MVLIIDNHDSFTYNLYHYFLILGQETIVKSRDEISIEEIKLMKPDFIVLSPGPGSPEAAVLPLKILDEFKGLVPILGVCLGHQCIGHFFGGKVVKGEMPIHGKVSKIHHDGKGLFAGLETPLEVTRYHSLIVEKESLPIELEITAETIDGVIMGLRHREYNIEGVQFHPEAILTSDGLKMLHNFLKEKDNV